MFLFYKCNTHIRALNFYSVSISRECLKGGCIMPRGDGTGPMGMGRMSGRGAGFCAGYGTPGYANQSSGRGASTGFGRGRGIFGGCRGWRHWFHATGLPGFSRFFGYGAEPMPAARPDPEMEKQSLKAQADALEAELEIIRKRLDGIERSENEG